MKPNDEDIMLSHELLRDLMRDGDAAPALIDLFHRYGRRPFRPDALPAWQCRGGRQRFARAISVLHIKGHLRWLPGGRYKVISRAVLTAAEFRQEYPDATWTNDLAHA